MFPTGLRLTPIRFFTTLPIHTPVLSLAILVLGVVLGSGLRSIYYSTSCTLLLRTDITTAGLYPLSSTPVDLRPTSDSAFGLSSSSSSLPDSFLGLRPEPE